MNKIFKRIGDIMVAITFAEAGEYDAARKIMQDAYPSDIDEKQDLSPGYEAI